MGAKGAVAILYRDLDKDETQRKVVCCGLAYCVLCFVFRIESMARCTACAGTFSTHDTPPLPRIAVERV
jgi:hypothetical protein